MMSPIDINRVFSLGRMIYKHKGVASIDTTVAQVRMLKDPVFFELVRKKAISLRDDEPAVSAMLMGDVVEAGFKLWPIWKLKLCRLRWDTEFALIKTFVYWPAYWLNLISVVSWVYKRNAYVNSKQQARIGGWLHLHKEKNNV